MSNTAPQEREWRPVPEARESKKPQITAPAVVQPESYEKKAAREIAVELERIRREIAALPDHKASVKSS